MKTYVTILTLLVFVAGPAAAIPREWTDLTGKYHVEAEFVDVRGEEVRLKKQDGNIIGVPISRLSAQDQRWVKQHAPQRQDGTKSSRGSSSLQTHARTTRADATQDTTEVGAPGAAVAVWRKWNGKYAMFVHREAHVRNVTDLAEKSLKCALINAGWEIVGDAQQFLNAAGVDMTIAIQNNPNVYAGQLLEEKDGVGFTLADVADALKISTEQRLVRITFVESTEDIGQNQHRRAASTGAGTAATTPRGRGDMPSAGSPDQPKSSQWPSLTGDLAGRNPLRVRNPNGYSVAVALRCGSQGKDFSVAAQDSTTVFVRDGRYDIYFRYSDDSEALYQGDSFTLCGHGAEIQLVKVVNGNYGIRRVK